MASGDRTPTLSSPQGIPSPTSKTLGYQIEIDESRVQPLARESAQQLSQSPTPWFGEKVTYDAGAGQKTDDVDGNGRVLIGAQVPSPASPSFPPSAAPAQPAGLTVSVESVRQLGQHIVPIAWQIDGAHAAVQLTSASPSLRIGLTGRARLSAWASPDERWVERNPVRLARAKLAALEGQWGIDDVTLVQTVRIADPKTKPLPKEVLRGDGSIDTDAVWWANNFMPTLSDAEREAWLRDAIRFFHARRIQVFVGYEIVTQDWNKLEKPKTPEESKGYQQQVAKLKRDRDAGDAFVSWLNHKGTEIEHFQEHAAKLVGFFDSRGLDIDGISYDLEIDAKNTSADLGLSDAHTSKIRSMFNAVGGELAKAERYLAFAAAPLPTENKDLMKEQPYSFGKDRNVLVRPMSYDIGSGKDKGRERTVTYALGDVHLHPSHLQVGVATGAAKTPISPQQITKECQTYRGYRVGVIHWFMTLSTLAQYRDHDQALNKDAPRRGTAGQPMQGPLGPKRLAAFETAAEEEKAAK